MVRSPELPPSLATSEKPNPPGKSCESWPRRNAPLGKSGVPPPARAVTKDSPSSGGAPPPRTVDATWSRVIPSAREAEAARRALRAVLQSPSMEAGEERRRREGDSAKTPAVPKKYPRLRKNRE
jgi:hypothetical protein